MAETIAAVSTALAPSGIGIIRLSGDDAAAVADRVLRPVNGGPLSGAQDRKLALYDLLDRGGRVIDRILAWRAAGPGSYTGEDTAELQCHGSPAVLSEALSALFAAGARQAGPGEFTRRAFLNGRMDLTAAEAVIDLIEAESAEAAVNAAGQVGGALVRRLDPVYAELTGIMSHFHAVLDYPDEDLDPFSLENYMQTLESQRDSLAGLLSTCERGDIVKNGIRTAILGRPNVGKSSLLNALAGYERAIVTDIPGTTRDTVEEKIRLGGHTLRLIDTAGVRETDDTVERIGVTRAVQAAEEADLVLAVLDSAAPLDEADRDVLEIAGRAKRKIVVLSKSDLPRRLESEIRGISLSAKTGAGLEQLGAAVADLFAFAQVGDGTLLTNRRHMDAVSRACRALEDALVSLRAGTTPDAVLVDVEDAMEAIAELTGRTVREDITSGIFSRFCVGK